MKSLWLTITLIPIINLNAAMPPAKSYIQKYNEFYASLDAATTFDPNTQQETTKRALFGKIMFFRNKGKLPKNEVLKSGHYSFDAANKFSSGEMVLVPNRNKSYVYGLIMGTGQKNKHSLFVYLAFDLIRDISIGEIGKVIVPKNFRPSKNKEEEEKQ
jgi:hypothetical protein